MAPGRRSTAAVVGAGTSSTANSGTRKRHHNESITLGCDKPDNNNDVIVDGSSPVDIHSNGTKCIDSNNNTISNNTATSNSGSEYEDYESSFYPDDIYQKIVMVNNFNSHLDECDLNEINGIIDLYDVDFDDDDEEDGDEYNYKDENDGCRGNQCLSIPTSTITSITAPATSAAKFHVTLNTTWGHSGICNRRKVGASNYLSPFLVQHRMNGKPVGLVQLFEYLFPIKFIKNVVLPNINRKLTSASTSSSSKAPAVDYGEFLRFLGLFFAISSFEGVEPYKFWSDDPIIPFVGAPIRLHTYMSFTRFEEIFYALPSSFVSKPSSTSSNAIDDKFVPVREMVSAFNKNMEENFASGWISATGTSIMPWTSKQKDTCPGFVCVPKKQKSFGNCFHTICCGTSGIMYAVDLVERGTSTAEQHQQPRQPKVVNVHGYGSDKVSKSISRVLRLTKSLQSTGKVVVLNSNFGGLHGIKELADLGIFASGKIAKRSTRSSSTSSTITAKVSKCQWPKYIDGDMLQSHFDTVPVGTYDAIGGTFDDEKEDWRKPKLFDIFCVKRSVSNISMIMSSYGTNTPMRIDNEIESNFYHFRDPETGHQVTYTPPEVIFNHDRYQTMVDQHNNKRLQSSTSSFEFKWGTDNWERRVFAFLLAITEVNIMLGDTFFNTENAATGSSKKDKSQFLFRQQLASALIDNPYYASHEKKRKTEKQQQQQHHRQHHNHDSKQHDNRQCHGNDAPCPAAAHPNHCDTSDNTTTSTATTSKRHRHSESEAMGGIAQATPANLNNANETTDDTAVVHELLTIPRGHKFSKEGGGQQLVPAKSDYPQRPCVGCKKKVRTYCRCTPGTLRCNECYCAHNIETRQKQRQAGAPSYEG